MCVGKYGSIIKYGGMSIEGLKKIFNLQYDKKKEKRRGRSPKRESAGRATPLLTFRRAAQRHINAASFATMNNYLTMLRSMREYNGGSDILLSDITYTNVCNYETWLKKRGLSMNTISCYMRAARSLYHKVSKSAKKSTSDPFRNVFTGNTKTRKRSLTEQEIQKVQGLQLPKNSPLQLSRDLFLFSFYTMGMPFVDMSMLLKSQVDDDAIFYARHKTGRQITVPMEPCIREIIRKYDNPDSRYVFPIIDMNSRVDIQRQYISKLTTYNRQLKMLAEMAGINKPLSSYMTRHTWASIAYKNNVGVHVISRALGHANALTTQIYITELDDKELAKANRLILNRLKKEKRGKK